MLQKAANHIGARFIRVRTDAVAALRRLPLTAVLLFGLALVWMATAGWWNYVRSTPFDASAYEHFQEEVAKCRELKTSEARYNCVAEAMIGRDQANFAKSLFVFLPPLGLMFGYYIVREMRAARREREHAAMAERHAREQILKMRAKMRAERAAAEAAHAENENAEPHHGPRGVLIDQMRPVLHTPKRA